MPGEVALPLVVASWVCHLSVLLTVMVLLRAQFASASIHVRVGVNVRGILTSSPDDLEASTTGAGPLPPTIE